MPYNWVEKWLILCLFFSNLWTTKSTSYYATIILLSRSMLWKSDWQNSIFTYPPKSAEAISNCLLGTTFEALSDGNSSLALVWISLFVLRYLRFEGVTRGWLWLTLPNPIIQSSETFRRLIWRKASHLVWIWVNNAL